MELQDRIKELCREKNVTIASLEKELNYSNGYISKINPEHVQYSRLCEIAKRLNTTPDYIFTGRHTETISKKDIDDLIALQEDMLRRLKKCQSILQEEE